MPKVTAKQFSNPYKFRAYLSAGQGVNAVTDTKIVFNTEQYDTNSDYDTSNGRYTAPVSGYYLIKASAYNATTNTKITVSIRKNNVTVSRGNWLPIGQYVSAIAVDILYVAAGDYLEVYVYADNAFTVGSSSSESTFAVHLMSVA